MKTLLSSFIAGFLAIGYISSAFGASGYLWFVQPGMGENPPYCSTIQQAVDRASAGNRIMVWPGNYAPFTMDKKSLIQISAQDPSNKPVITDRVLIQNSDNIIISNIKVTRDGIGVRLINNKYVTFEGCDIDASSSAIYGTGNDMLVLKKCTFTDSYSGNSTALSFDNWNQNDGRNVFVNNCTFYDTAWGIVYIYYQYVRGKSVNITITDSAFNNLSEAGVQMRGADQGLGFSNYDEGLHAFVSGNTFKDSKVGVEGAGNSAVTIDLTGGNTYTNCVKNTNSPGAYVKWITALCPTCGCPGKPYQAGSNYAAGDIASNRDFLYECKVPGWCNSIAAYAYEPGVGSAWHLAWDAIVACETNAQVPCGGPFYSAGALYQQGQTVRNLGNAYRCNVPGWCSSVSALYYAPGTGLAWQTAWTLLGACN